MVSQLLDDLGLRHRRVFAPRRAVKVLREGRLHVLPRSLGSALTSSLLSPAAKLRVLLEPLLWRPAPHVRPSSPAVSGSATDRPLRPSHSLQGAQYESLASSAARHLGAEALRFVVEPALAFPNAIEPSRVLTCTAAPTAAAAERRAGGSWTLGTAALRLTRSAQHLGSAETHPGDASTVVGAAPWLLQCDLAAPPQAGVSWSALASWAAARGRYFSFDAGALCLHAASCV